MDIIYTYELIIINVIYLQAKTFVIFISYIQNIIIIKNLYLQSIIIVRIISTVILLANFFEFKIN